MWRLLQFLLGATLVVATACTPPRPSDSAEADPPVARVTSVVDGDTIDVVLGGTTERVRLIGIDTPETVDDDRPVECFGPEASAYLSQLLPEGTQVDLVLDAEPRDRFGRLLAYVFRRSDGLFVNEELARLGYAELLVIEPNVAYRRRISAAVNAARTEALGLWSACVGAEAAAN